MSDGASGSDRTLGRRGFLTVAGGVVGAAAVAGLGATAGVRGLVPHSAGGDPKSLTMSFWAEGKLSKLHLQVLQQYKAAHPDVTVQAQYQPQSGYDDKLSTQLAGGNAPDMFMLRRATFSDYISRGAVRQLDDLVPGTLPFASLPEALQQTAQYKGHWYAIPLGLATSPVIIADKTMFDGLGVDKPDLDWSLTEFEQLLRAIQKSSGGRVFGASEMGGSEYTLTGYLAGAGKPLFTDAGRPGFTRDDLGEWYTLWQRFRKDGLTPPMSTSAAMTGFTTDPIVKGVTAMTQAPSSKGINGYQPLIKHTLELLSFPRRQQGGPPATSVGPIEWFALSSRIDAAKAQQAAELGLFFAENLKALQTLNLAHGVPLTVADRTASYPTQKPLNKLLYDNVTQIQESGAAPVAAYPPGATEVLTEITNQNQQVGFGRASVDAAVTKVFDAADRVLS